MKSEPALKSTKDRILDAAERLFAESGYDGVSLREITRAAGVELALSGLTTATFLNGQTVTIASILPGGQNSNQITAAFTHADYTQAADTGIGDAFAVA